jgi:hypothetical protein
MLINDEIILFMLMMILKRYFHFIFIIFINLLLKNLIKEMLYHHEIVEFYNDLFNFVDFLKR